MYKPVKIEPGMFALVLCLSWAEVLKELEPKYCDHSLWREVGGLAWTNDYSSSEYDFNVTFLGQRNNKFDRA